MNEESIQERLAVIEEVVLRLRGGYSETASHARSSVCGLGLEQSNPGSGARPVAGLAVVPIETLHG